MNNIFAIILVFIQYFFNPEQVKKREEKKIERETEKLDAAIDEHINNMDAILIASDIDNILSA